jgi:predicted TIM-barrel fold metal-dependent hydrolase
VQIIDCDACFGFLAGGGGDTSLQGLLEAERAQAVSYVMAYSLKARAYDAREGNDDALAAARAHEELIPVGSVDPRSGYRFEDEIARVAKLGFAALRVFPELQGWSVDSALFGRIVDACAEHDLPLMLSIKAAGVASQAVRVAKDTSNELILLGAGYGMLGDALSAAATRPNTLISTSQFITPGVVEIAAEMVGVDNLVVGTFAPEYCIRPSINMILGSELSPDDQAKVLAGNMRRVIGGQMAKLGKTLGTASDRSAYDAHRLKGPIIDVHGHVGPWPFPMRNPDAACIRDLMGRWGISRTLLSHTKAIVNDFVEGNAELASAIKGSDDLFGYVTINPNYPEQSLRELEKYLGRPNFVGVKYHPGYARMSIDSPETKKLVAQFASKKLPFLVHTWGPGEVAKIGRLADEFPELPIIMGHGGADGWRDAIAVLKNTRRTYTEFCNSMSDPAKLRTTIDQVGADRVLFGTDAGLFDPAYCTGMYEEADLTDEEQKAILHDNAVKLFGF